MDKQKRFLNLLLVALVFFGCDIRQSVADALLLDAGDMVKITVYGHSDLTTEARVGEDGKIAFPLISDVQIGGLSSSDAEMKIANLLLKGGFVKDAQVSIFVVERRHTVSNSVVILGLVEKPGIYPLQGVSIDGVQTIIDLIAMAGGTSANAAEHLVLLRRDGSKEKNLQIDLAALLQHGDLQQNITLAGGDIVFVPEMDVFYIYGQVQHPGRYRLERNMSIMQAISVSGGVNERGNENGILLKRKRGGSIETYSGKLTDELQAGDVLYVKESIF